MVLKPKSFYGLMAKHYFWNNFKYHLKVLYVLVVLLYHLYYAL